MRRYAVKTASGHYEVVARRWWHPKDRRATRLAARVMGHMEPQLEQRLQAEARRMAYRLLSGDFS